MANPYDDVVASLKTDRQGAAPGGANPYDGVLDDIQIEQQKRTRYVFEKALSVNPDAAAEAKKLANQTGLAPDVVARNLDEVRRKEQARMLDLARMAEASPVLARQLADPEFTKQAHDDIGTLTEINRTLTGTLGDIGVTTVKAAVGLPQSFVGIADLASGGLIGKGVEATGIRFKETQKILDQLYSPAQKAANKRVEAADGFFPTLEAMLNNPSTLAITVLESAPQMIGGAGVARGALGFGSKVATVGPTLPGLLIRKFGEKYAPVIAAAFGEGTLSAGATAEQFRGDNNDGLIGAKETLAAITSGTGTALFSLAGGAVSRRLGLEDIDTALVAKGVDTKTAGALKTGFVSALLKGGISEGVFEELPQSVQEQMWQNWATDKPIGTGVGKVAAQGVLSGFSMGGGYQAVARVSEHFASTYGANARADQLKAALETATQSKLRERNPEEFRNLMQRMAEGTEGAPAEVFVDAEVLNQLAPEILQQLPQNVRDQLPDALAANDVVGIPVGDVLTIAPGTELEQMLVDNARVGDPRAMTRTEAQQASDQAQQYLTTEAQRVIEQANDQQAMQDSADRVKQSLLDQLNTAGRFRNDVNEAYATWTTAFYTTMAGRLGLNPEEMAARYPLKIAAQSEQAGAQLEQGTDVFDLSFVEDGNKIREFKVGDSRVVLDARKDYIKISSLRTPQAKRGAGNARAAMQALIAQADAQGVTLKLDASALDKKTSTAKLVKFYRSLGFELTGRTINPFGDPEMVREPQALAQTANQTKARATLNPATLELVLNANANLSSYLHENGHFFLEVMADLANQPNAPAEIADDMNKLLTWFGITGDENVGGQDAGGELGQSVKAARAEPTGKTSPITRKPIFELYDERGGRLGLTHSYTTAEEAVAGFNTPKVPAPPAPTYTLPERELPKRSNWKQVRGQKFTALDEDDEYLYHVTAAPNAAGIRDRGLAPNTGRMFGGAYANYSSGKVFITERSGVSFWARSVEGQLENAYESPPAVVVLRIPKTKVNATLTPDDVGTKDARARAYFSTETLSQDGEAATDQPITLKRTPLETWMAMTLDQKRKYHERFAESMEQYLLEGKAPSVELQPLFRKFRAWMLNVYKSLKQFVSMHPESGIVLSDEIRQVFDRMVASAEQIAQAEESAGLLPDENATDDAIEKLTARSLRDLKWTVNARAKEIKKLQKQAAEMRKGVEAEVRAEVEAMPVYAAQLSMRGENKLDIGALAEMYAGEGDRYALLDWKPLVDRKLAGKAGVHPDILADSFGYASGDEMVRAVLAAEPMKSVIQGMTDQRMLERHGDLIDDRAIAEAANEAVHNEARARSLATELKSQADMLNRREDTGTENAAGNRVTVNVIAEAAKQFAANVIARTPLRDLKSRAAQHVAAERRAGKRWQEATAAGKTQDAVKAKQDQVLNNAAAKAALEAQQEAKKIIEFFRRVVKDGNEKTVERGRDPDVVNAARAVLAAYGVAPRAGKSALEYMEIVQRNDPAMYAALNPSIQGALNSAQPLDALTMEELRGLNEEIQAMWHLAKRSRQMEVDGNLMDIEDAEDELKARMQEVGVPDTVPGQSGALTKREEAARKLQFAGSLLRRVESWAEAMDGKFGGPFLRLVFQPVKEAADRYRADRVMYRKAYQELIDKVAPYLKKGVIEAPELGYTFGRGHNGISHAELLHAILHTGNDSNKRKLLLGREWATENPDGTLDTRRWDAFIERMQSAGTLTKEHYDFAQGVWDLLEQTKPLAQKTHRDVFGRYFAEVTANEVTTPFGTYRGGYVPAQADPRIVLDADMRKLAEAENENMAFSFPTTNKGFTQSRVDYNRPLMLDLRSIGQHLDKVLLFAHMEPAVRDVQKLLTRKGVSYQLGRIDPTIFAGMLTPWLNRSARQTVETPVVGDGGLNRILSVARNRAGMALMFANVSNTLQQLTGFSLAAVKVKPSHMMRATAQMISSPRKTSKAVSEASAFMANRMENEISAINDAMDQILLDPSLYEKSQAWAQKHAYFLQTAMAASMEPIIWTGAYNQALSEKMSEKDAVRFADNVIRTTQGSTLPEDVSRMETGPSYARAFTQFVGYFNMMANTNATALQQLAREVGLRKGAGKALGIVTLGFLAPIWVAEIIALAMRGGPKDEDDDGYLDDWLAAVFGIGTIKGTLAMVPFVGQLGNAAISRFNNNPADDRMSLSPAVSLLEATVGVPSDIYKAITDPDKLNARNAVRDVASAVSIVTGLPAYAIARPLGYLAGVEDDRINPTGPVDMARGIVTGTPSPQSK